jgi:hypothetical protein
MKTFRFFVVSIAFAIGVILALYVLGTGMLIGISFVQGHIIMPLVNR